MTVLNVDQVLRRDLKGRPNLEHRLAPPGSRGEISDNSLPVQAIAKWIAKGIEGTNLIFDELSACYK